MPVYIPPEILDHIFTFARGFPPTWEEDVRWTTDPDDDVHQPHPNATLLSASLVNKAWAEAAQRVLCYHAVFPSSPREPSYSSWIESDARRRHRTMSVWIRPCKTAENLARVLDNLHGVVSLTLGRPLSGAEKASWAVLQSPGLKDLNTLSLYFVDYFIPNGDSLDPLPFSLNSLAFDLFTERASGAALLSTLLAASQNSLRTLSIRQSQDSSASEILVPIPLPNLRHLILEEYSETPTCLGEGLKSFKSLEKLELRGQTIAFEGYQSYWNLTGLYFDTTIATLPTPSPLRHLVLGIDKGSYIAEVEVKLSHQALAGLEVLELMYLWRSDVVSSEGADLIETCKRRSITLSFNHWFKSYLILISPPLSAPASTPAGAEEREARARAIQAKRDEYERECGAKYKEYQKCVWAGIKKTDGLKEMVEKARKEDPLTGWGEIKVVKEEDLRG